MIQLVRHLPHNSRKPSSTPRKYIKIKERTNSTKLFSDLDMGTLAIHYHTHHVHKIVLLLIIIVTIIVYKNA